MKKTLSILLVIISIQLVGQQKQMLTIEDCILKRNTTLAPQKLINLSWVPNTNLVSWRKDGGMNGKYLTVFNFKSKEETVITHPEINLAIANYDAIAAPPGSKKSSLKKIPYVTWQSSTSFLFTLDDSYYTYDYKRKAITTKNTIIEGAENVERHQATGNIAYTVGNNVFIKPLIGNNFAVTNDTEDGIVNGTAVHRVEFGITKGLFWNNAGNKLAYYRMDESMVTKIARYKFGNIPGGSNYFRYPMAGQKSHQVKLAVYDAVKNTTIYLETGEPVEQYLTNVAWSPDDKYIYLAIVQRDQATMSLKRYNATTGKLDKVLFDETNERYVEPEHPPVFCPDDKDKFIWQSERDGFNHLYLYNSSGKLIRQLTKGNWMVTNLVGIDEKGKYAYFTATKRSPLDNTVYKVKLSNGDITELATDEGMHYPLFNSSYSYLIDNHSSYKVPRNISIKNTDKGKVEYELLNSSNPLENYKLGETSVFTIKSTDGTTDLYARMIKPVDFDPNKKYPVAVYVYGGPHLQLINNSFLNRADLWMNYMAQQGFVVFSLDNRGSANRGFNFESTIHRKVGSLEVEDQLAGVNFLKQQSFVDSTRMAVFGWSFGGFMTTSLMLKAPGTFKVGVAGGPVIDWKMYEVMYTERYMDTPQENPTGFENSNLLNYVQNLEGKLLMIHGTSDPTVVWQHSLEFVKKAVTLGKQMDYFPYPAHEHNVRGKERVHLYQKVTDYIMDNINK